MSNTLVLAADFRAIGLTVTVLTLVAFVGLWVRNMFLARDELGSEIELAPNRKPYLSDEELEGPKLDKSLTFALVMLAIVAAILPFYWLAEPGRQEGAVEVLNERFVREGENLYTSGAQCVNCHASGGVGGSAPYVLQDGDGQFLANASWAAPSLNDVLHRYSEDEVRFILNFGRPGSPMAAWGTTGGGPLTTQQVDNVILYLETLQGPNLDPVAISVTAGDDDELLAQLQADAHEREEQIRTEVERSVADGEFETIGEAVFNLGLYSGFGGGGLSCARCHTAGWSLGPITAPNVLTEGVAGCGGGAPSGIGYNLCGNSVADRFPDDSWKAADGSWLPPEGISDSNGFYIEAADGSKVRLDEGGKPVTDDGEIYLVLDVGTVAGGAEPADSDADSDSDLSGDLAVCDYISQLWQPQVGPAYPFDAEAVVSKDENGSFVDPDVLDIADVPGENILALSDGRLAGGCTVIDMPERTSQAHLNFVAGGANAGSGYGQGGLSAAGMMPGFAGVLPPDYLQAVVDYERGL